MFTRHFTIQDNRHLAKLSSTYLRKASFLGDTLKKIIGGDSQLKYYTEFLEQFELISRGAIINAPKLDIFTHLFYAHQFGVNHFKISMKSGPVTLKVGNTDIQVEGNPDNSYTGFGIWSQIFYLAMILRDKQSLEYIFSIPDSFMLKSTFSASERDRIVTEIFRNIYSPDELLKSIQKYEAYTTPEDHPLRENFKKYLYDPMVDVLKAAIEGEEESFNNRLENALKAHRDFYSVEKQNYGSPADPFSWLSFKLIAICVFAFDNGMPVRIKSDYLPEWMITGDFKECQLIIS